MTAPTAEDHKETRMLAYHNRPELKAAVLAQIDEHRRLDRIVRGTYERCGKNDEWTGGCAVGCTLESLRRIEGLDAIEWSNHALYERYLGIPRVLARLEDGIFEGLPLDVAMDWPARFAAAIRPGADLSMVWPRFALDLLTHPDSAVVRHAAQHKRTRDAVAGVAALYRLWVEGAKPSVTKWREARQIASDASAAASAAYATAAATTAAAYAAYAAYATAAATTAAAAAADASAAAYAAYATTAAAAAAADASAAADAASAAAYAADAAAAAAAAGGRERQRQADVLIALLESC